MGSYDICTIMWGCCPPSAHTPVSTWPNGVQPNMLTLLRSDSSLRLYTGLHYALPEVSLYLVHMNLDHHSTTCLQLPLRSAFIVNLMRLRGNVQCMGVLAHCSYGVLLYQPSNQLNLLWCSLLMDRSFC
jgi:hypothetical protein